MAQFGAYTTYYADSSPCDPQRASSFPSQGQGMSRVLSNDSNSSHGTFSSISDYGADLPPATPDTAPDMSSAYYYGTVEHDQVSDYNEYTESYYTGDQSSVPAYYDQGQEESYTMSPSVEMGIPFGADVPRTPVMPAPTPDSEIRNGLHVCLVPDCNSLTMFKRKADLQRHFDQRHQPTDQKKRWFCDYSKCMRHEKPFHRIDHFRDHYRDYHLEDLPRKQGESDEWYQQKQKSAPKKFWRCVKCLSRVSIKDCGFRCTCGSSCESPRQSLRGYD